MRDFVEYADEWGNLTLKIPNDQLVHPFNCKAKCREQEPKPGKLIMCDERELQHNELKIQIIKIERSDKKLI